MSKNLNPDKALIFRITHRDNVPWILDNGLQSRSSGATDPNFITIGNPDLIDKRQHRYVPIPPGGTLSDYVPFYFTPFSPMMYNIKTGHAGIRKRDNEEIVIFASSLYKLEEEGAGFVYTDRHAYLHAAEFSSDLENLNGIDWRLLQNRDFRRDPNDPEKVERYQAEALVHQHVPINALLGVVCNNENLKNMIEAQADQRGLELKVVAQPTWYFR